MPSAGSRLAGEREYAFKHVLIRDVAYSMLPKAVRARKHAEVGGVHRGARRRPLRGRRRDGRRALRARRHARRRRRPRAGPSSSGSTTRRSRRLEAAGDAAAALYSNPEALGHYETALSLRRELDPDDPRRGSARSTATSPCGSAGSTRPTEVWEQCLEYHRREEDLARVGDLHRKIGAGLWHKGDREGSIEHYQRGIDLLKDGPPCLELVRLYEEAASLYMHTGDNMLAIYASEKALRLAERLGEAAAASRAHGIFGRVFGRIGDSERARENLERSVELARESDPGEAVRALLTLGYHLEVSEADYEGAGDAYGEALALAEQTGDLPSQVELHAALAQLAAYRGDWEASRAEAEASRQPRRARGPDRQALLPLLDARGAAAGARATSTRRRAARRAAELAEQVGRSEVAFQSLHGLAASLRDRGDHADADTALARALDLCERAGLVAQSVEATRRGRSTWRSPGRPDAAREAAEEAGGSPSGCATRSARPPPRGARRRRPTTRRGERGAERGPRRLGGARPPARRGALRVPSRPPPPRCRSRGGTARARGGRHRRRGIRRRPPGVARARPHPCLTQTRTAPASFGA